ncbi:MAG: P-II family nitrogen regulator [Lachnospiraceae bacterium]|nr:P-II family nitrogen regulator [Lachnospiraceae bacterium]MEE1009385.1 P-II family nitrogen regulator [Agathobacter sp.]
MSEISKIEVITGMSKLTNLIKELSDVGVRGVTVMQVLGCGVQKGTQEYEIELNGTMELLPKQQINIVVETEKVDKILDIIKKELYTGHIGDGKIFVYGIDNVIRVRTGDEGIDAL